MAIQHSGNSHKKVATIGTFDCLHEGHKEFLRNASQLGKLYVIIVPSFIKFINKGYLPVKNEYERMNDLLQFGTIDNNLIENVFVDCCVYGLKSLILIRPDIIIFGYDQKNIWSDVIMRLLHAHGIYPDAKMLAQTSILMHNGKRNNFRNNNHINNKNDVSFKKAS